MKYLAPADRGIVTDLEDKKRAIPGSILSVRGLLFLVFLPISWEKVAKGSRVQGVKCWFFKDSELF